MNNLSNQPEMSRLIFRLRQRGLGTTVSRQKYTLSREEELSLGIIFRLVRKLRETCVFSWQTREEADRAYDWVAARVLGDKEAQIVSIFCPSYRRGAQNFGYNCAIGEATKRNLETLKRISTAFEACEVKTNVYIYFSDLLLENYGKLIGTCYRYDLEFNLADLREHCSGSTSFTIQRLSCDPALAELVGEAGATTELTSISPEDYAAVTDRNASFYREILGWSDAQVAERTRILALSYPYLAQFLNLRHPASMLLWSESAYERIRLMPNLNLPVIFPCKS